MTDHGGDERLRVLAWPGPNPEGRNPYPRLLAAALEAQGHVVGEWSPRRLRDERCDVWHMHWPEHVLRLPATRAAVSGLVRLLGALLYARTTGVTIVWTVHNLRAHDAPHPMLDRLLRRLLPRFVHGWLSLSAAAVPAIEAAMPGLRARPHAVVPHGDYRSVYAEPTHGPPSDGPVLFLGAVRRYKGVDELVRAFAASDRGVQLRVRGAAQDDQLAQELRAAAAGDDRIELRLDHVPDAALTDEFGAAALVVLPFRRILNSGSVLLALSMNRPVLVPSTPVLEELRAQVGEDWVRCYDGPLDGATLDAALEWAREPRAARAPLDDHDWGRIARDTAAAYRRFSTRRAVA